MTPSSCFAFPSVRILAIAAAFAGCGNDGALQNRITQLETAVAALTKQQTQPFARVDLAAGRVDLAGAQLDMPPPDLGELAKRVEALKVGLADLDKKLVGLEKRSLTPEPSPAEEKKLADLGKKLSSISAGLDSQPLPAVTKPTSVDEKLTSTTAEIAELRRKPAFSPEKVARLELTLLSLKTQHIGAKVGVLDSTLGPVKIQCEAAKKESERNSSRIIDLIRHTGMPIR